MGKGYAEQSFNMILRLSHYPEMWRNTVVHFVQELGCYLVTTIYLSNFIFAIVGEDAQFHPTQMLEKKNNAGITPPRMAVDKSLDAVVKINEYSLKVYPGV